ncbi:hypothetical protein M902_0566 [Bacteriovorax sp. BAL6_X]|uniref:hypothetical protein n=1 Tax=Bacteriovorax sp. BAL6_X TaxID=1201290 RepID=UPI000385D203|nr:hypothetical protein [Bacteriovorax sp. BAL6_X]EPZ49850.1 hypothetical protein M902_0566 [Bacteriovorax sp. BAL6_X]
MGISLSARASESGVLYRNGDTSITYDRSKDQFIFRDEKSISEYSRFRYNDLILEKFNRIPVEDHGEIERRLKLVKKTYHLSAPAPEEILQESLADAAKINESDNYGCGDSRITIGDEKVAFTAELEIEKLDVKRVGLFGLGALEGTEFELNTSNDNPLHGGLMALGVTSFNDRSGFEGDDRGLTFGSKLSAKLKFENGDILFSYNSKAYTKLVEKPCGMVEIMGRLYERYCYQNDDGSWNQEGINRDDIDISVYRKVGDDKKSFVQLGGGITILDDNGLAMNTQRAWHKMSKNNGTVQYKNYGHMEQVISPKATFKVGKIYDYKNDEGTFSTASQFYTGGQISQLSGNENYIGVGGEFKVKFEPQNSEGKFPAVETRFYYDGQYTQNGEINHKYGVEAKTNVYKTKKSVVYIKVGMGIEDDHYSREYEDYGKSFLNPNLDIQHYLGIGIEKRF